MFKSPKAGENKNPYILNVFKMDSLTNNLCNIKRNAATVDQL